MSTTGNEYEEPGVNYPDRKDADGATDTPNKASRRENEQRGTDPAVARRGGRRGGSGGASRPAESPATTPSASASSTTRRTRRRSPRPGPGPRHAHGGARRSGKARLDDEQEQRLPAMAQNNASEVDKVAGIVAQTRNDLAATEPERVPDVLRQRLEQSGIDLPDAEIDELARQITTGDA